MSKQQLLCIQLLTVNKSIKRFAKHKLKDHVDFIENIHVDTKWEINLKKSLINKSQQMKKCKMKIVDGYSLECDSLNKFPGAMVTNLKHYYKTHTYSLSNNDQKCTLRYGMLFINETDPNNIIEYYEEDFVSGKIMFTNNSDNFEWRKCFYPFNCDDGIYFDIPYCELPTNIKLNKYNPVTKTARKVIDNILNDLQTTKPQLPKLTQKCPDTPRLKHMNRPMIKHNKYDVYKQIKIKPNITKTKTPKYHDLEYLSTKSLHEHIKKENYNDTTRAVYDCSLRDRLLLYK